MPFLIRGLELPDPEIRANILQTFISVADSSDNSSSTDGKDALSEHATTLVSIALQNAVVRDLTSVVRYHHLETFAVKSQQLMMNSLCERLR